MPNWLSRSFKLVKSLYAIVPLLTSGQGVLIVLRRPPGQRLYSHERTAIGLHSVGILSLIVLAAVPPLHGLVSPRLAIGKERWQSALPASGTAHTLERCFHLSLQNFDEFDDAYGLARLDTLLITYMYVVWKV